MGAYSRFWKATQGEYLRQKEHLKESWHSCSWLTSSEVIFFLTYKTHTQERMCIIFRTSNVHDSYHEGYFLLILGLPPNGEHDDEAENEEQHKQSDTPHLQPGNGMHSVRGQDAQTQNQKGCKGDAYREQSQRLHVTQTPSLQAVCFGTISSSSVSFLPNTKSSFPSREGMADSTHLSTSACFLLKVSSSLPGTTILFLLPMRPLGPSLLHSDCTTWVDGILSGLESSLFSNGKGQVCPLSTGVNSDC